MKFKVVTIDPFAEDINEAKTEQHFLRNLNTEKMFRDDTGEELQAQISTLMQIQVNLENEPTNAEYIAARADINFADTRHEVLKYMYAELKNGALVQSEKTREDFEKLEDLDEQNALNTFFRNF